MIKKSVFEDELIHGMQRELQAHDKKQGMQNLVKAAEYLNAAVEIFEQAGMTAKADQVLRILGKIASPITHVRKMPSMKKLMDAGVTKEDLLGLGKGHALSKARVNTAFRSLGYTDKEIADFIGAHNMMGEREAELLLSPESSISKIQEWIKDPSMPIDPSKPQPGERISFESISQDQQAAHKPNGHTQGLTSEKMVENLKNHGIVFNLTDDAAADDIMNVEINDEPLEVMDEDPEKTFEDSH